MGVLLSPSDRALPAARRALHRFSPSVAGRLTCEWKRRRGDLSLALTSQLVGQGDVALDIGANWGLFTGLLAGLVGREGQVHAFEPHPDEAKSLDALGRRRGNVTVHRVALSDRTTTGELRLPVFKGERLTALASLSSTPSHAEVDYEAVPVALARLDDLIAVAAPKVSFIKCDVEGHELSVLRGGEQLLRRSKPRLLIEIEQRHQEASIHATFDFLSELGYVGWCLRADGLASLMSFDLERDQLAFVGPRFTPRDMADQYVRDFLFVHREASVSAYASPR